jgi:hypothetical protein
MSSIINIRLALLKLQQKLMSFFLFSWEQMEESIAKRKEKPTKSPDGSTHRKAQKAKTNVIVAKVSPSKTPENNPMKYNSREKHHIGPDEEFFPHFIKYGGSVFFSTFPMVWDQNFLESVIKKFLCWE